MTKTLQEALEIAPGFYWVKVHSTGFWEPILWTGMSATFFGREQPALGDDTDGWDWHEEPIESPG